MGGSYQKGNWDSSIDPNLAIRIMKRAVDLCPSLTGGLGIEKLDIIRHGVGLRPLRLGGTRLEKERVDDIWVVHNYGHGGYGYQVRSSYVILLSRHGTSMSRRRFIFFLTWPCGVTFWHIPVRS